MDGELAHVRPYLGDQDLRCPAVDPWDGVKELYLLRERGDHPLYLHARLSNGLLKVVDVSQHPANHEAMVSAESPFQCFPQSRDLRAKAAPSQLRQYLGIGGAANAVGPTAKRPYTFAFPIVGGKVDKHPLGGKIVHSGGLSFSADSEKVVVKRFVIELDRGVLSAKVAGTGQRIALLRLGAPEGVKVGAERIVLRGVDAKLTAQAAKALNEAFDTDLFAGGLLIGEATVIAKYGDADKGEDSNVD
jgi:hypothetical protein